MQLNGKASSTRILQYLIFDQFQSHESDGHTQQTHLDCSSWVALLPLAHHEVIDWGQAEP